VVSLRRQINDSGSLVAQFFKELIPGVRPVVRDYNQRMRETSTLRPTASLDIPPWGTIGTAIDYRIRYYFGITSVVDLVAVQGARMLFAPSHGTAAGKPLPGRAAWSGGGYALDEGIPDFYMNMPSLAMEFFLDLELALKAVRPVTRRLGRADEERLNQYCYVLSLFDQLARLGTAFDSPLYTLRRGATIDTLLKLAGARVG
jgi:hypothetical protein